jgi:mRNA interferase MazF
MGDVVLVPFLFTDLSDHKIRPAVVIGVDRKTNHVILCFITTQDKFSSKKVPVKPSVLNGLRADSFIIPSKIMTLEKKVFLGSIGKLEKTCMEELKISLKELLDL